ncbi:tyrosine-type recombinase/integrase [Mesonia aquimarina]|uniref:tyrosine-type recombinase/integrase n=1 Tax=Mesonia aquimarina TaxID=1504967 RepID=UPI000EF5FFF5|nr:site-specific integrase [Mesonia aquimarina]
MKATVKLYKTDGQGEYGFPVKLIISHNRKTRRKTIGYSFEEDWDLTSNLPLPSHDDFEDLYTTILDIRKKAVLSDFRKLDDFPAAFDFFSDKKPTVSLNFYSWMDKRIKLMESQNRNGNASIYRDAKKAFETFSPQLNFKDITPQFIERFKNYQKELGNKNTSIRVYIATIRANYNAAVKAGVIEDKKPFIGALDGVKIKKRRAKNRYLSEETLREFENLSLEHPSYQRAIDFCLLQFYFCGADLIDIYYLKKNDLSNNRVFLTRRKLGDRQYEFDILLTEKAQHIIDKYKCDNPKKEYLFSWPKAWTSYKTFRDNHNRNLKILQKRLAIELLPKNDNLTSKVMRHTFATMGKFARIEEDLLRELMGHERNDIDTVYKDKYPEAERDAAQLKIIGQ